jgi:hypothetical protein
VGDLGGAFERVGDKTKNCCFYPKAKLEMVNKIFAQEKNLGQGDKCWELLHNRGGATNVKKFFCKSRGVKYVKIIAPYSVPRIKLWIYRNFHDF